MTQPPEDANDVVDLDSPNNSTSREPSETSPHDELVKVAFQRSEDAASVLSSALAPELSRRIDWTTLEVVPTEHIGLPLDKRYSDALYRVHLVGRPRPAYVHVLCEHQSSSDPIMALRMLSMMTRHWEALLRAGPGDGTRDARRPLPLLLSVVLYQGENGKGWRHATELSDLIDADEETLAAFRPYIPSFRFVLDDLDAQSDEALFGRALTDAALITLLFLRDARYRPDLLDKMRLPELLAAWRRTPARPGGVLLLQAFWIYAYRTLDVTNEAIHDFAHDVGTTAESAQMTALQRIIEKVGPELEAKGRVEGRVEGARATLKRQLSLKFGDMALGALARIDAAGLDELTLWTDRILTATTVEELFR